MSRSALFRAAALAATALAMGTTAPRRAAAQSVWTVPGTVAIQTPTASDFMAGFSAEESMTLMVLSSGKRPWRLYVRAASPDMGGSGKPSSDVLWRTPDSGSWAPLSTGFVQIAEGRGFTFITVSFRVRLQWDTDEPGAYDTPVEFGFSTR